MKTLLTEEPDASMSAAEKATMKQWNTESMAYFKKNVASCSTQTLTVAQATELKAYLTAIFKVTGDDSDLEAIVAGKMCLPTKWDFKCVFFSANRFSKPSGIEYLLGLI